jgi:hypothetical protein
MEKNPMRANGRPLWVWGGLLALALTAAASASDTDWHERLEWRGQQVGITHDSDGSYQLHSLNGLRRIPAQTATVQTASALFDGLFAMAQDDLREDSVSSIVDGAFNHGQPIPCDCFATGEKWPYVWTRDLSYSVDLSLWRFDPNRARNSLLFKTSDVREATASQGRYVAQDTGSGGSWPISTDRVVWFLGARHLMDDGAFADQAYRALVDTLAQDRLYAFDTSPGLYRGETSFLDWREQTYPGATANNVVFIAQSFALSTNVLHYEALRMAGELARQHGDSASSGYVTQAEALKKAINAYFWRADRGMYMSYIGGGEHPAPYDTYDLLGLSLAIVSGVADADRARTALSHYPTWPAGSPVIWPERADVPIYHNRAIWPFVSAYALRAARVVDDPLRIEHELRSLIRGAALAGSNMENFELTTQAVHVDDGRLSGPVVDSPRQLWSVAGYLDMVVEGVFGLTGEDRVEPKLPVSLVPMLFGDRDRISLNLPGRRITLIRPAALEGNLLVSGDVHKNGTDTVVRLKAIRVPSVPLRLDAPLFAPAPVIAAHTQGEPVHVTGAWPRTWTAPTSGWFTAELVHANDHGPVNTGVTAAVKQLVARCEGDQAQSMPIVMPHSLGEQRSTFASFQVRAGARCTFMLEDGFNMSYLAHFARYAGGQGGIDGPLNTARIGDLLIAPMATGKHAR